LTKKPFAAFLCVVATILAIPCAGNAETRTVCWDPVTEYLDNTPIESWVTVTYTIYWSSDPEVPTASLRQIASAVSTTCLSFDPDTQGMTRGETTYLTATATLSTGEESGLASPCPWVVPTLTGLSISGSASVNEKSGGTYTATATWSDNTTTAVTPAWTVVPTTYASISSAGVLTTLAVAANQPVTVTASYTAGGITRTAAKAVTIVNVAPTLSSLSLAGPASVNEKSSGTYTATAAWSDYTRTAVTPTWSVAPSTYASISTAGVLTTLAVAANQSVTVTASYTAGGITRTATRVVTIVNVAPAPAPPMAMHRSGPLEFTPVTPFRLSWDAVSTCASGAPSGTLTVSHSPFPEVLTQAAINEGS